MSFAWSFLVVARCSPENTPKNAECSGHTPRVLRGVAWRCYRLVISRFGAAPRLNALEGPQFEHRSDSGSQLTSCKDPRIRSNVPSTPSAKPIVQVKPRRSNDQIARPWDSIATRRVWRILWFPAGTPEGPVFSAGDLWVPISANVLAGPGWKRWINLRWAVGGVSDRGTGTGHRQNLAFLDFSPVNSWPTSPFPPSDRQTLVIIAPQSGRRSFSARN